MTTPESRTFVYSSVAVPRLLRPAQPGELHVWLQQDGSKKLLVDGVWTEWVDPSAEE